MLIISNKRAAHIFATKRFKVAGNPSKADIPSKDRFPEGLVRVNSCITEVTDLKEVEALAEHPEFIELVSDGTIRFVSNSKVVDELPTKKKKAEKGDGMETVLDVEALAKWPKKLEDLKTLDAFNDRDASEIAQNTVVLKHLQRWQENGKERQGNGLTKALEDQIKRISAIDASVRKSA